MLLQHVSTHMSHYQANLEPLKIFEFLLTVLFVSKAADPCVKGKGKGRFSGFIRH
jgi:hypothetical protein